MLKSSDEFLFIFFAIHVNNKMCQIGINLIKRALRFAPQVSRHPAF